MQPTKDGHSQRVHLERAAARGSASSRKTLTGPPLPDAAAYLWDWTLELHGRSGNGFEGSPNVLSYQTLLAWSTFKHLHISDDETYALFTLDMIMSNPDAKLGESQ